MYNNTILLPWRSPYRLVIIKRPICRFALQKNWFYLTNTQIILQNDHNFLFAVLIILFAVQIIALDWWRKNPQMPNACQSFADCPKYPTCGTSSSYFIGYPHELFRRYVQSGQEGGLWWGRGKAPKQSCCDKMQRDVFFFAVSGVKSFWLIPTPGGTMTKSLS